MTFLALNISNNYEDGIILEIQEPNLIVLPSKNNRSKTSACLKINIAITNKTLIAFPFVYGILTPELLSHDGQEVNSQKLINTQIVPSRYHGIAIPYQKTLSCYFIAKLFWDNNLLKVQAAITHFPQFPINLDYFWAFEPLQLGTYQLRFSYLSPKGEFLFFDTNTAEISQVKASITNVLTTSWVSIQLLEPLGFSHNAIELDRIRFETVVPEQIWKISRSNNLEAHSSIQIGLCITNNTSVSQRFCSYNTLIPALLGADSLILGQNLGGGSHGWFAPRESDFYLVMPRESIVFFVSAYIEKQTDGLLNLIIHGTGYGYWSLKGLALGSYQLRLAYRSLIHPFDIDLFEDLWKGMVHTPFVKFCLVQP
jgi:hypothetical protein